MDKKVEMRTAREWYFGYESKPGYWLWSKPERSLAELSAKYADWIDSHPNAHILIRIKGIMVPAK